MNINDFEQQARCNKYINLIIYLVFLFGSTDSRSRSEQEVRKRIQRYEKETWRNRRDRRRERDTTGERKRNWRLVWIKKQKGKSHLWEHLTAATLIYNIRFNIQVSSSKCQTVNSFKENAKKGGHLLCLNWNCLQQKLNNEPFCCRRERAKNGEVQCEMVIIQGIWKGFLAYKCKNKVLDSPACYLSQKCGTKNEINPNN